MSFPSKLIEYLATGRPVLTTRIQSIPESFKEHFYFIEDESVFGVCVALREIMDIPVEDRLEKGRHARNFVNDVVSEQSVGRKIAAFVNQL
jgi:glycosyltransferase involved in cell wall biosynthesis